MARIDAANAVEQLADARAARTVELAEMMTKALCHSERLAVIVEGDLRADRAE